MKCLRINLPFTNLILDACNTELTVDPTAAEHHFEFVNMLGNNNSEYKIIIILSIINI